MPGFILTLGATLTCPHGGLVNVSASTTRMSVGGLSVVRVGDQHTVSGCPFRAGDTPQPCVRVVWGVFGGGGIATRVSVGGQSVILAEPGSGACLNNLGQQQGSPIISTTQNRARGV